MLFHTWTFLVFFLVVYTGYLLLKGTRFRLPWLLTASYVFYGWWNPDLPAADRLGHGRRFLCRAGHGRDATQKDRGWH